MVLKTPLTSTITTGGASQRALPASEGRKVLIIQNTDDADDLWLAFSRPAAATAPSFCLGPLESMAFLSGKAPENDVHVFGASTGAVFTIWEG